MINNTSRLADNKSKSTPRRSLFIKQMIKSWIKEIVMLPLAAFDLVGLFYSSMLKLVNVNVGNLWADKQEQKIAKQFSEISHSINGRKYKFKFYTPNWLCRYRANTFSTKEPETLAWIDTYGSNGVFFDIGANVGLYSIYYGMTKTGNVYSFEPSVFNLGLLAQNINANGLQGRVKIVSNPLTEANQFANFNLSTTEAGGALSAFGVEYGQDGKSLNRVCSYQTLGLTLDFLFASGLLTEAPSMIKIDVDGIEHLILRGAAKTLASPICKTVLVEVSMEFKLQAEEVSRILTASGFALAKSAEHDVNQSAMLNSNANQVWIKK